MNPRVFREYDIRGVANLDLTDAFCDKLGRAIGTLCLRRGATTIAVGRDARLSSPRIHAALTAGLATTGIAMVDVGVVPTPVLYFAPKHWQLGAHVMITGSHNPGPDNGFKLGCGAAPLYGESIQALMHVMMNGDFETGSGTREERDAIAPYIDYCVQSLDMGERRFPVVVDAGNGVGGPTALRLYRALGFDVTGLHCEPDGAFPNHHPDPTVESNLVDLKAAVGGGRAEVGIALDGDADRIGAIDANERVIWGDQLMLLFGRAILADKPGATFIAEVKCSQSLFDELERAGGNPVMWKVGHSLIKSKMQELGADLAGEMSGHMFFAHRYLGYDDGIYAGARLLELLSRGRDTLAQLYDTLPVVVNTPEIRLACPDDIKFDVVARAAARLRARDDVVRVIDIDGARAVFEHGWGLVRASNTGPVLVVRCEATTTDALREIRTIIETEIDAARAAD